MKRTWWIVAIVAVVGLALLGGGGWFLLVQTQGPRVDGLTPVRQPISQTLLVTGRVAQPARTDLGAMVQSTVVEVLVDEGDDVESGQLLVRLADEDAAARVREAEARVAEAEAKLGRVRGIGRSAARVALERAEVQAEDAQRTFERQDRLFEDGGVTEAELDTARRQRDTARADVVSAKLELAASGQTGADTNAAAASLAAAQASLESAQVALDRTRVRAPTAGRVLQRLVQVGQVVRPGDPLVRFSGGGDLEIVITPDEVHLGQLSVGQRATVSLEAFPAEPLSAHIARIAPQVDPNRGTVEVRLALDDSLQRGELRPDMTATVEVLLGQEDDAVLVPNELVHDLGTLDPWVLTVRDGVATRQAVQVGLQGTDAIQITDGIGTDDVLVGPGKQVEPGDPVRVRGPRPALPPTSAAPTSVEP